MKKLIILSSILAFSGAVSAGEYDKHQVKVNTGNVAVDRDRAGPEIGTQKADILHTLASLSHLQAQDPAITLDREEDDKRDKVEKGKRKGK